MLQIRGELADAEGTWRALLAGYDEAYGAGHPLTAYPMQGLATTLEAQDRAAEAEPLFRRALELLKQSFGEDHADVHAATNELARCLERHGKVDEALTLLFGVVDVQRRTLPAGHPSLVTSLNGLGQALRRARRFDEAVTTFESAIAMGRASKDLPPDLLSQCLYNLGVLLRVELKRHADAVPLLEETLERDRALYPPGTNSIAGDMFHLASALLDSGQPAKAEPILRALLAPPYDLGPNHNRTPGRIRSLAQCVEALGRGDEARDHMRLAVERAEAVFGPDDDRTRGMRADLERMSGPGTKR
jgi:tetratricopeptide (TPR) repeat protein